MTQRRVENTRVHFWKFSPVSVKIENEGQKMKSNLGLIHFNNLTAIGNERAGLSAMEAFDPQWPS